MTFYREIISHPKLKLIFFFIFQIFYMIFCFQAHPTTGPPGQRGALVAMSCVVPVS